MGASFVIALLLEFWIGIDWTASTKLLVGVGTTTVLWVGVTLMTPPESSSILIEFYTRVRPASPSWRRFLAAQDTALDASEQRSDLARSILCMFLGILGTYALLFGTGKWIYGEPLWALVLWAIAGLSGLLLYRQFRHLNFD